MSQLPLSIPYLLFISCYILLVILELNSGAHPVKRKILHGGCIILYLFFIGLRGHIGTDWYAYYTIYENIPALTDEHLGRFIETSLLEKGFLYYVSVIKAIHPDYYFFTLVSSVIDILIIHCFLRRYVKWYTLGFLVFIIMGGLMMCDLLRNIKSILLFLLSLRYLYERKALAFFALNLAGLFFHVSSIIYLPLYFILHRTWPRAILATVFIAGNLVFLLQVEYLRPAIEYATSLLGGKFLYMGNLYLATEQFDERYNISIGYLERFISGALVLGYYRKLIRQRPTNVMFVNAFTLYFASFFLCSEIRELSARLSVLFIFAYWVLYPALYEEITSRFNRSCFLFCLICYSLIKVVGMTSNILYKYDNILWGTAPYEQRAEEFERFYLNRNTRR